MLEFIIITIQAVLAPLSVSIVLAAIVSGLFFGAIYNHNRNLPESLIYHKFIAGIGFITTVFLFRLLSSLLAVGALVNPAGWIGIGLLWGIFCLSILIGYRARKKRII